MKLSNLLYLLVLVFTIQSCDVKDSRTSIGYWNSHNTDWELGFLKGKVKRTEQTDFNLISKGGEEELVKKGYTLYNFNKWGFIESSYNETYNTLSTTVMEGRNVYRDTLKRGLIERYSSFKDDYQSSYSKPFESETKFEYFYNENEQLSRIETEDLLKNESTVKLLKYEKNKITEYEYDSKEELIGYTVMKYNNRNQLIERNSFPKQGDVDYSSFSEYKNSNKVKDSIIYYNSEGSNTYVFHMDDKMRIIKLVNYSYVDNVLKDYEVEIKEYDNDQTNSSYISKTYKDKDLELLLKEERIEREFDEMGNVILETKIDMIRDKVLSKSIKEIVYYE